MRSPVTAPAELGPARWRGQRGRTEVWYTTFSDGGGTGYWIHHETVAPTTDDPYSHGWAAVFPVDGQPELERFGPEPVATADGESWFACGDVAFGPRRMAGTAGSGAMSWDLDLVDGDVPLWTFPRTVWEREVLPGAQVVAAPRARVAGSFRTPSGAVDVDATGASARIYGHGNAQRWCWLHAELGDGAVLEVVAATPRRPGLRHLPLVPMVQLRIPGQADWPRNPLIAAAGFRARITGGGFRVRGIAGRRRLTIDVTLPAQQCVSLRYTDPDGATATCTNSERADAEVVVEELGVGSGYKGWREVRRWSLAGTAHAEIGKRPASEGDG